MRPRIALAVVACWVLAVLILLSALLVGNDPSKDQHEDDPLGESTPPIKIAHVQPIYPPEARDANREGRVILQVEVEKDGSVDEVRVLRSALPFDSAAIEAVRQWRYKPAMKDGEPVRVYITVTINFRIK